MSGECPPYPALTCRGGRRAGQCTGSTAVCAGASAPSDAPCRNRPRCRSWRTPWGRPRRKVRTRFSPGPCRPRPSSLAVPVRPRPGADHYRGQRSGMRIHSASNLGHRSHNMRAGARHGNATQCDAPTCTGSSANRLLRQGRLFIVRSRDEASTVGQFHLGGGHFPLMLVTGWQTVIKEYLHSIC